MLNKINVVILVLVVLLISLNEVKAGGGGGHGDSKPKVDPRKLNNTEYLHWCVEGMATVNVFKVGRKLDCSYNIQSFSLGICIVVAITVLAEFILKTLHRHLKKKPFRLHVLHSISRELMLLGFISFSVIFLESTGVFEFIFGLISKIHHRVVYETAHELTERRVKIFDVVHLNFFFLGFFYIIFSLISFFFCRLIIVRWARFEKNHTYAIAQKSFRDIKKQYSESNCCSRMFNLKLIYQYFAALERYDYWIVRQRFIRDNKLEKDFCFRKYMKLQIEGFFLEMLEIDWKVWLITFLSAGLHYLRVELWDIRGGIPGVYNFVFVFAFCPMVVAILIFGWNRISYLIYTSSVTKKKKIDGNQEIKVEIKWYFFLTWPYFTFLLMQLVLFSQCFFLGFMVSHQGYSIIQEEVVSPFMELRILFLLTSLIPTVITVFIFIPLSFPPFVILYSLEKYVSKQSIRLSRQKRGDVPEHHGFFSDDSSDEEEKKKPYRKDNQESTIEMAEGLIENK